MIYIYEIKNKANGKSYIGSTNNLKQRWYTHKHQLKKNIHANCILQSAWDKYGEDSFCFSILEIIEDDSQQYILEQRYLDTLKPEYNISKCAGGCIGYKNNEGKRHPNSKISESDVIEIKTLLAKGVSTKDILEQFAVNKNMVISIKTCRSWKHILPELNAVILQYVQEQPRYTSQQLKEFQKKIVDLYIKKFTQKKISEVLNINLRIVGLLIQDYLANIKGTFSNCVECGKKFIKKSNNHKYCKKCSKRKSK